MVINGYACRHRQDLERVKAPALWCFRAAFGSLGAWGSAIHGRRPMEPVGRLWVKRRFPTVAERAWLFSKTACGSLVAALMVARGTAQMALFGSRRPILRAQLALGTVLLWRLFNQHCLSLEALVSHPRSVTCGPSQVHFSGSPSSHLFTPFLLTSKESKRTIHLSRHCKPHGHFQRYADCQS